jgi:hypothetical protein
MRKRIADLHRRAETSQAANDRYLKALVSVEDATPSGELTAQMCQPVRRDGRRTRPLNPHAPEGAKLFSAIRPGEFAINGFRNGNPRGLLFDPCLSRGRLVDALPEDLRRNAAAVLCKLASLRLHRNRGGDVVYRRDSPVIQPPPAVRRLFLPMSRFLSVSAQRAPDAGCPD